MRKLMAVFAVLFFLFVSPAQAAEVQVPGAAHQFSETWVISAALDASAAYVLDRDGQLYRWDYTNQPPTVVGTLPVATREMYMNYAAAYPFLPEENKAQIRETVSFIVSDGNILYAINKPANRLGIVDGSAVLWQFDLGEDCFLNDNGEERIVHCNAVLDGQLFLVLDYWEENPAAAYHCRILQIDLQTGATHLSEPSEARSICPYGHQLLVLCENSVGVYFMQFNPSTGSFASMNLQASVSAGLAYDMENDAIYISNNDTIYCSAAGKPFAPVANMPAEYVGASGTITSHGHYAFTGDGLWAVQLSNENTTAELQVVLQSPDSSLKSLFAQYYPDVLLDWRVDTDLTAAQVANAIRTGDTTAVFSVAVDSSFASLVAKGFAAPLTNQSITSSVDRMYPSLSAPLKNAAGDVVAYPWSISVSTWGVNDALWSKYFPNQALPTTWKDFFSLMQAFEQADNPEGNLFLMNWNYETMLENLLYAFIQRANMRQEPVDFTDPVLIDTLSALNTARQMLLNRGVDAYDEAEIFWDSEAVGDHSIFHYGVGASNRSAYLWSADALTPFVFTEGDTPIYPGNMRVLILNPNAPNPALAEAFIALLTTREYSLMQNYILHADATQPYAQRPYAITSEMVAQWQQAADAITFPTSDPLQSDAFTTQAKGLIQRYAAGQLDDWLFLSKLNETAAMVENEAP